MVGHDWGAAVAWTMAGLDPKRLTSATMIQAPHPAVWLQAMRADPQQRRKSRYVRLLRTPWLSETSLRLGAFAGLARAFRTCARPEAFAPETLAIYREAWGRPGALTGMLNGYRALFLDEPPTREPKSLEPPTLVLWGDRDAFGVAKLADASAALCANARLRHLPQATRWILHDAPGGRARRAAGPPFVYQDLSSTRTPPARAGGFARVPALRREAPSGVDGGAVVRGVDGRGALEDVEGPLRGGFLVESRHIGPRVAGGAKIAEEIGAVVAGDDCAVRAFEDITRRVKVDGHGRRLVRGGAPEWLRRLSSLPLHRPCHGRERPARQGTRHVLQDATRPATLQSAREWEASPRLQAFMPAARKASAVLRTPSSNGVGSDQKASANFRELT